MSYLILDNLENMNFVLFEKIKEIIGCYTLN